MKNKSIFTPHVLRAYCPFELQVGDRWINVKTGKVMLLKNIKDNIEEWVIIEEGVLDELDIS